MQKRNLTHIVVLSAALMIACGPYLVRAAGNKPAAGDTAMVDLMRVYDESDARKAAETRILEYGRMMGKRFDEIAGVQYLTANEIEQYTDALNADNPGPAEKQKIEAIRAESAKRVTEAQALNGKKDADLSAADRTRLRELTTMLQQQNLVMQNLQRLFQNLVNAREAKEMRLGLAEVRAVISKLAKDQGITQVFDTSSLVYAQADLTQAALLKVQKKK